MRRHGGPALHVLVCANRREAESPLGTGCAERGEEVYRALKNWVAERGLYAPVWVTETRCLGICPRSGCTIAIHPDAEITSEVTVEDAVKIVEERWAKTKH
jgi:(2Fe-2S) ferredoxin